MQRTFAADETLRLIREFALDVVGALPDDFGTATTLTDDLDLDSLTLLELLGALERETGVEIPEEKLPAIVTAGDIVALVADRSPR
jgi:acyl carrier protein